MVIIQARLLKSRYYLLLGYDHGSLFESPSPKDAKPCCAKFG